jgi:hypothetical protein
MTRRSALVALFAPIGAAFVITLLLVLGTRQ